ncbi:MAG: choline/glycine/proline betaine transport protein, partial [Candidatus Azotimanducaceae bacterium]
ELILHQGAAELGDMVKADPSVALFQFFEYLPGTQLLSLVAVVMVIVFFVTSADSGAMVVNMLASNGRDDTPLWQRVFWTFSIGIIAAILLAAGGLPSLQTAAIASALPFSIALLFAIWGFWRALEADIRKRDALAVQTVVDSSIPWQERLNNLFQYPSESGVVAFQNSIAKSTLQAFANELIAKGLKATVSEDVEMHTVRLEVWHGEELDFVYTVSAHEMEFPDDALVEDRSGSTSYWRAEVHLGEGGQDYDVMGWTNEQIANDILEQYERHLNYLKSVR